MGKKKRRDRRSCTSSAARPTNNDEMQWSLRVLDEDERSAYEAELGEPRRYFEVVGVDRGRGMWVRDIGSLEDEHESPDAPPGGAGALAFFEDPECSVLFESGNLFTGSWQDGRVAISGALRKSLLSAAIDGRVQS